MDLTACYASGTPLYLADLLAAARVDFGHDLLGITRTIDRTTGHLTDHFLPRYARHQAVTQ